MAKDMKKAIPTRASESVPSRTSDTPPQSKTQPARKKSN